MKPHVICLMASSVDGRTLHSRWRPQGGAALFEQVHDELAGDAWLVVVSPARSSLKASRTRLQGGRDQHAVGIGEPRAAREGLSVDDCDVCPPIGPSKLVLR
jgi:riboflavin biosynthesis pyrimidine reductase